jgi:hypothetical protein
VLQVLFVRCPLVGVPGCRSRGPGFDSRSSGSGTGPISFLGTTEEVLGRTSSGLGLQDRDYGRRDPLCRPQNILYTQKLAVTSPTSGDRSVGIVRSQTKNHGVCFRCPLDPWTNYRRPLGMSFSFFRSLFFLIIAFLQSTQDT